MRPACSCFRSTIEPRAATSGFRGIPIYQYREQTENSRYFPADAFHLDRIREDFGADCLFRPEMKPGDVAIASNWIIHGSHENAAMTKNRASMELRIHRDLSRYRGKAKTPLDRYRMAAWFQANRLASKLRGRTRTGLPFWATRM